MYSEPLNLRIQIIIFRYFHGVQMYESCKIILQVVAENIIIVVFGSCPLTNKAWLDHNSFEPNLGPPSHWCQTDSVLGRFRPYLFITTFLPNAQFQNRHFW